MAEDIKVCRICFKLIPKHEKFYSIKSLEQRVLDCLPDICSFQDLTTPYDSLFCTGCYNSLKSLQELKHPIKTEPEIPLEDDQCIDVVIDKTEISFKSNVNDYDPSIIKRETSLNDICIKQEIDYSEVGDDNYDIGLTDNAEVNTEISHETDNKCIKEELNQLQTNDNCCINFNADIDVTDNGNTHKCVNCPFQSVSKRIFLMHLQLHRTKGACKCNVCNYTTRHSFEFSLHEKKYSPVKSPKSSLKEQKPKHINVKQEKFKQISKRHFKCVWCNYSATSKQAVEVHLRKHTGEKPFKCQFCDYTCTQQSSLKIHTFGHTGEKPHKCTLCDYSATCRQNIMLHIRTHTGEKPYKCDLCSYCSTQNGALRIHKKAHLTNPTLSCSRCDYKILRKCDLEKHLLLCTNSVKVKCK